MPWKRIIQRRLASALLFLWLTMLAAAMVATAPSHDSTLGLFVAAAWIIIYAGVLLAPLGFALAASLTLGAYGISISISPTPLTDYGQLFRVGALAMTALIVGTTIHELRSQATDTVRRIHALNRQRQALRKRESELMQLYEVSRTIGLGEDLREVLPELVARTAGYVEAKVGLVALHRPEQEILAALSPIWVAGQALEAEGYDFAVGGDATAAVSFQQGEDPRTGLGGFGQAGDDLSRLQGGQKRGAHGHHDHGGDRHRQQHLEKGESPLGNSVCHGFLPSPPGDEAADPGGRLELCISWPRVSA